MRSSTILAAAATLALAAAPASAKLKISASKALSPRLTAFVLETPSLNFPADVRVLLPADYAQHPKQRYPVLYLLHGSFDDAPSWTAKGNAEKLTAGLALIVVMPATTGTGKAGGWASDWVNEGRGGPPKWETFTIKQLIPWIQARYRTRANRAGRAVAGLSMGGFSSMSYAVRHPDLFSAASSYSGAVDTNNLEVQPVIEGETVADGGTTPDAIWGPRATSEIVWRAHNPWDLAANLQNMVLAIRTGNGQHGPYDDSSPTSDPIESGVHDMSVSLHQRLDALHIAHVWDDYGPGPHSWPYWQRALERAPPRFMAAFAHPPKTPDPFTYTTAERTFSVYGWRVAFKPTTMAWTELRDAGRHAFTLKGTGTADVTTAPRFRPGSKHTVTVAGAPSTALHAGRAGRLHIKVALGDAETTKRVDIT